MTFDLVNAIKILCPDKKTKQKQIDIEFFFKVLHFNL